MELRRLVWSLLVEELTVWNEMSGVDSSLNAVQKDRLLQALLGMAPRHRGDQLAEAGLKWIREHSTILACLWRYMDLYSSVCPPLLVILLEIGALLQRPQPPALSMVQQVSAAMFTTELAVNDHSRSAKQILQEMADLLPQTMPPFLLGASPLPSHTLWSPLSDLRTTAQQIFSLLLECPDLPSCSGYFSGQRIEHITQLCGILSASVVQSLATVDHSLSPRNPLTGSSGRCSPFAFSVVHQTHVTSNGTTTRSM